MYRNAVFGAVCCLAAALSCVSVARADFEAGQAGRPAEAMAQWGRAAEAGDARAMLALGRAHVKGLGVSQDFVEAHKWLNLGAARGNAEAAAERDALAARMTPEQIASAQGRARSWRPGGSASALEAVDAPAVTASSRPAGPPPPRAVREAQALLAALGYKPGSADGRWGPRTGRAHAAFLRDAGLPLADMLTPEALRAMRTAARGWNVTVTAAERRPAPPPGNLHRLVQTGDVEGVKAALASGVDVNARDARGWTALMYAADRGYALFVQPLLKAGASPNLRLADGATALFIAVVHGHSEIVGMLMRAGADISIRGPKGKTAVDAARMQYGEPDAARERGMDAAVLALLAGRTWAEVKRREAARLRRVNQAETFASIRMGRRLEKFPPGLLAARAGRANGEAFPSGGARRCPGVT